MIGFFVFLGLVLLVVFTVVHGIRIRKNYMKNQKETGEDKRKLRNAVAEVMPEVLDRYTLAVGNYTKTERWGRTTTYYYYSYALAFNETDLVIFPFSVKDARVKLRNCMQVNWDNMKLRYKVGKKGVSFTIRLMGESLDIIVPAVQNSSGIENSAEPLGIYQEAEVEKFISYLPKYKEYAKE